jgi:hypothetical protein
MMHLMSTDQSWCKICSAPGDNPFYSNIDSMPELKLAQRKSIPLVSDLVSIHENFMTPSPTTCNDYAYEHHSNHLVYLSLRIVISCLVEVCSLNFTDLDDPKIELF